MRLHLRVIDHACCSSGAGIALDPLDALDPLWAHRPSGATLALEAAARAGNGYYSIKCFDGG